MSARSRSVLCLRQHGSVMPFSWKQNTWCGEHIPLSCPLPFFCIPSLPQNASSLPTKIATPNAVLKPYRYVAANLCHCYFGGDSLFSVIVQRRSSSCAAGVCCRSNRLNVGGKNSLTACLQQTCLQNATAVQGSCSPVDISCLCSSTLYLDTLACCLSKNCNQADQTCTYTPREIGLITC